MKEYRVPHTVYTVVLASMRKFAGFRYLKKAETRSQSDGSAVRPVKTYSRVCLLQTGTYPAEYRGLVLYRNKYR